MRLRMVTLAAGPDGVYLPGSIVEVEDETAARMVAGGYALPVDIPLVSPSAVAHGQERAVNPAPGMAERRKGRKKCETMQRIRW